MDQRTYNPFSLRGKRILITGASSGIGRSCARECSKLGANIVLVGRRKEQLEETLAMLEQGEHRCEVFDLTAGEAIVPWMKSLSAGERVLDGMVHSAGLTATLPIRATSAATFDKIISTNLTAAFFLTKGFRQRGVRAKTGSIIYIGSVISLVGQAGLSAYSASKSALVTMSKSLALELAPESIRVNVVAPGHVHTAMAETVQNTLPTEAFETIKANHPLGIGEPEDVALAAAFLLSDAARWITGTTLLVDGGYTAA